MQAFHNFIDVNPELLAFIYGLAYFSAGLAVFLQRRGLSNFRLAHNLWLVGVFFIVHGVARWGDIFIPIQSAYLSESGIETLHEIQRLLWATSFFFLLQFGVAMIAPVLPWTSRLRKFVQWYSYFWSGIFILGGFLFLPQDIRASLIRYLVSFPATVLAAAALLTERRRIAALGSRKIDINLKIAAGAFGVYAVLSLLMVQPGLPGMSWLNESVLDFSGFSVHFWRMLVSVIIAFFIIRTLSVFDLEVDHRLEQAEKDRALLTDRQRIARDLHDGVVQSIYAAGLQLEAASKSARRDSDQTSLIIGRVVAQLNDVIADMRKYIFRLGPARTGENGFEEFMSNLADEFTVNSGISAEISVQGDPIELSAAQRENIAFVARESLSNALRHAQAKHVDLKFIYEQDSLFFVVEDDGIGIDIHTVDSGNGHHRHGLKSMAERAAAMKGDFSISQRSADGGTMVALRIPYSSRRRNKS